MPKEQLTSFEHGDIKENIGKSIVDAVGNFLEKDSEHTVSQTQMEAFVRILNALPDGKFKELVRQFEGPQKISSKFIEAISRVQDEAWKIVKPFVVLNAPLVTSIPKEPFRKLAIKSSQLGGFLGEKVIKTGVEQTECIKNEIQKIKRRKKTTSI